MLALNTSECQLPEGQQRQSGSGEVEQEVNLPTGGITIGNVQEGIDRSTIAGGDMNVQARSQLEKLQTHMQQSVARYEAGLCALVVRPNVPTQTYRSQYSLKTQDASIFSGETLPPKTGTK